MGVSKLASVESLVRRMVERSDGKARKMSQLRAAIADGSYRVSAAALAERFVRAMRS